MASAGEDRVAVVESVAARVRDCTFCRLHATRTRAVPGEGPAEAAVLLLGEAPGRDEDAAGRPFVGSAGRILDAALKAAGLPRDRVFITNVVKCRPPANRAPRPDEMEACRPYLVEQIAAVRPKVIVTLGSTSLKALLGKGLDLREARAKPQDFSGRTVVVTYHPAAVLYNRKLEKELRADLRKVARMIEEPRLLIRSGPPRKNRPAKAVSSSGGAIVDASGRILLLRRADEDTWCLPKGTQEAGETLEMTALREIREETGLRVRLLRPIHTVRYAYFWPPENVNYEKSVTYFLAEPVGGRLTPESGFDEARWLSASDALALLHWKNDRDVVAKTFNALAGRPG